MNGYISLLKTLSDPEDEEYEAMKAWAGSDGVLLSPADYDELVYRKSFLESVDKGLSDAENGRTYRTDDIKAALIARRSKG